MRSSHFTAHRAQCERCQAGKTCPDGLVILRTRWDIRVPTVPVSAAGTARVDVRALITGGQ